MAEFADNHDMFPTQGLILAAVSGGADSVCLLSALLELSEKKGFFVAAAHFNHQLRGSESDRDARFVADLCRERNISLYTAGGNVRKFAADRRIGIEEAAREMRYAFFRETAKIIDAKRIATAHTADDNAETVLLNLVRGSGLKGLGGIPPVRDNIIRPMLTVTRSDVLNFLAQRSIAYVEDSSNTLDIYARNLIRHRVIPVLKEINPRFAENVTSTAALVRDDEAFLNGEAMRFIDGHFKNGAFFVSDLLKLPRPISSRVIRLTSGRRLSNGHVSAVLKLCRPEAVSGETAIPSGSVFREYDRLVFSGEPVISGFAPRELLIGGSIIIPELGLTVSCKPTVFDEKINNSLNTFLFKSDNICGKIVIRPRKTGDNIELFGRSGTKTLKKLFIEERIPLRKRHLIPVIADRKGVLAVYGIGTDKRAACKAGDHCVEVKLGETSDEK